MNAMSEPTKRTLTAVDGVELAVFEGGRPDGIELLLLHGFATDHSAWGRQFSSAELPANCRLIAPDLRGHGNSGKPSRAQAYVTRGIWADDLAHVIEGSRLRRPIVIAWSFAGRTINDYLEKYGQSRLAGINYVAAASIADPSLALPDHVLIERLCSEDLTEVEEAARTFVSRNFGEAPGTAEFARLYRIVTLTPPGVKKYFRSKPIDYAALLPTIALPVLATHGENDTFVKPELTRRLAAIVKNGHASIYPNSGHAPFYDQAERFNSELFAFAKACQA
jgi:non-heme chloroperoxidase